MKMYESLGEILFLTLWKGGEGRRSQGALSHGWYMNEEYSPLFPSASTFFPLDHYRKLPPDPSEICHPSNLHPTISYNRTRNLSTAACLMLACAAHRQCGCCRTTENRMYTRYRLFSRSSKRAPEGDENQFFYFSSLISRHNFFPIAFTLDTYVFYRLSFALTVLL